VEYTTIDSTEDLTGEILRNGALTAEREAVIAESEANRRLIATRKLGGNATIGLPAGNEGQIRAVKVAAYRKEATDESNRLRARAARKAARAEVPTDELARVKLRFLQDERIPSLEREHFSHATKRAERQAAIDMPAGDPDGPTDTERDQLRTAIKGHDAAMAEIDEMWVVARAELEQLLEEFPDLKEEAAPGGGPLKDEAAQQEEERAKVDAERETISFESARAALADPSSLPTDDDTAEGADTTTPGPSPADTPGEAKARYPEEGAAQPQ
jgi:hypothetical protein